MRAKSVSDLFASQKYTEEITNAFWPSNMEGRPSIVHLYDLSGSANIPPGYKVGEKYTDGLVEGRPALSHP